MQAELQVAFREHKKLSMQAELQVAFGQKKKFSMQIELQVVFGQHTQKNFPCDQQHLYIVLVMIS